MNAARVSVIIPTVNEESSVADAVESALKAGALEIIVADGGSEDATTDVARQAGASTVVTSERGRGAQLAAGAASASGEWLLFLHADNLLGSECLKQIQGTQIHSTADTDWGAFYQRIQNDALPYRLLEWGNAARVRLRKMPFGDQAMFVRRSVYESVGGFQPVPLMEDVELAMRLRRTSRPRLLPGPVLVDSRRWQRRGVIRQTARNWFIQAAYACGVSESTLASWYR